MKSETKSSLITGLKISIQRGFTLIELLVVIAIIGVLAAVILAGVRLAWGKAQVSRAVLDLDSIKNAIGIMQYDTGLGPNHTPTNPCADPFSLLLIAPYDEEIYLDESRAGLESTDGGFSNWSGPYIPTIVLDPWGHKYMFDPDYQCIAGSVGCSGLEDQWIRAIHSGGPNGSTFNEYDADNIVLHVCF